LDDDVDLEIIASSCNGYVGADLEALCREAARLAYRRTSHSNNACSILRIRMEDWISAKSLVGPSMTRGVAKEVSKVSWDDIGGLKDLKVHQNSHLDILLCTFSLSCDKEV
jgi:SpoVK/Ycf46/Vps4 family AAA+-type ATPase